MHLRIHAQTARRIPVLLANTAVLFSLITMTATAQSTTTEPEKPAEVVELPAFEVRDKQDSGYRAANSVSATRIDTPIRDLPLTLDAFTEEFIKDIQPRDLLDIVTFAPGVSSASNDFAGGTSNFNIRGFSSGNPLRNGFKGPNVLDPLTIARVEVARGPSSVLYGQLPPGGLVNYVTKRPLDQQQTTITQRIGTNNLYRTELDTTGPVGQGSDLYYRLMAAYDHNHEFYDPSEGESTVLAPVLQWRTDRSTLTLDYQHYEKDEAAPIFMKPFFVTPGFQFLEKVPGVPHDFNALGDQDRRESKTRALVADWQFNVGDWNLRASHAYARQSIEHFLTATLFIFDTQRDNPLLTRTASFQAIASKDSTGQVEAARKFKFGAADWQLLVGYQNNRRKEYFSQRSIPSGIAPPAWVLRDPSTWDRSVRFSMDQLSVINDPARIVTDSQGLYLVNHVSMFDDRLGLLGGVRFSTVKSVTINEKTNTVSGLPIDQEQTSPQVGIMFKVTPQLSAYASYSESFVPTGGAKIVNGVVSGSFDPTVGKGYDIGLKADFYDGRISGTLAYFEVENTGIVNSVITSTDPQTGNPVFTTFQSGSEASRGVELSGVVSPADGWQFLVSYSYLDAYVKTDRANPARQGLWLSNTANHYFNFWGKHTVQQGDLKGLYLAGGVQYTGKRLVHISNQNLFWDELPLFALSVGYTFNWNDIPTTVDLSCKNLTNEEYFPTNNTRGDPRLLILSVSAKF